MSTPTKEMIEVKVGQVWELQFGRKQRVATVIEADQKSMSALMMPEDGLISKVSFEGLRERWVLIKSALPPKSEVTRMGNS